MHISWILEVLFKDMWNLYQIYNMKEYNRTVKLTRKDFYFQIQKMVSICCKFKKLGLQFINSYRHENKLLSDSNNAISVKLRGISTVPFGYQSVLFLQWHIHASMLCLLNFIAGKLTLACSKIVPVKSGNSIRAWSGKLVAHTVNQPYSVTFNS